ncbi:hypothetical protein VaNZ11_001674, partial [Volvox africanus]
RINRGSGGGRGCLRGHGQRPAPTCTSHRPSVRSMPNGFAPARRQPHNANEVANSLVKKSADAKVAATRRRTLQTTAVQRQRHGIFAAAGKDGGSGGSGGGGDVDYRYGDNKYEYGGDGDDAHAGRRSTSITALYKAALTAASAAADDILATATKSGTGAAIATASDVSSGIYVNAEKPLTGSTASSSSTLPYRSYTTDKLGNDVPIRTRTVDPENKFVDIYPIYMDGDAGSIAEVLQNDDGSLWLEFGESSAESQMHGKSGVNVGGDSTSKNPRRQQQLQQGPLEKETEMEYILYDVLGDKSVFDEGPDSVAATRHDGHLPVTTDTFPYDIADFFLQQMYEYLYDYTSDGTTTTGVNPRRLTRGSATAAGTVDKYRENDEEKAASLELWQALYDMFSEDDATFGPQQEAMYIRLYEQDPVLFWAVHDEVVARRVGDKGEVGPGRSDPAANPAAANPAAAATTAVIAVANGGGMVIDTGSGSSAATADKVVLWDATSEPGRGNAAYEYPSRYGDDVYESEYDQMLWGKEHGNHLLQGNGVRQQLNEKEHQQQQKQEQDVMWKAADSSTAVAATAAAAAAAASAGPSATSAAGDRKRETVVAVNSIGDESSTAAAVTAVGAFAARDVSSVTADPAAMGNDGASLTPTTPTTTTTTTVTPVTAHGSEQAVAAAASHLVSLQAMSSWSVRRMQPGGAVRPLSTVPEVLSGAVDESAAVTAKDAVITNAPGSRSATRDAALGVLKRAGTIILFAAVAVTITALFTSLVFTSLVAVAAFKYHRGRLAYAHAAIPNQRNTSRSSAAAPTVMIRFVYFRGARSGARSDMENLSSLFSGGDSGGDNGCGHGALWHRGSSNTIAASAYWDRDIATRADNRRVHGNVEEGWAEQHQCSGSDSGGGGDGGGAAASDTPSQLQLLIPPLHDQPRRASGGGLPLHDSSESWISQIPIDRLPYR